MVYIQQGDNFFILGNTNFGDFRNTDPEPRAILITWPFRFHLISIGWALDFPSIFPLN